MLNLKCTSSEDIFPFAYAVHMLLNKAPVTMRSKEKPGVRIEKGVLVDNNYEGYVLKQALYSGEILKVTPIVGPYKNVPVIVVPIVENNEITGAIGIVDLTAGIFEEIHSITRRPELAKFLPEDAFPR